MHGLYVFTEEMHLGYMSMQANSKYTYPEHLTLVAQNLMMRYNSEVKAKIIEMKITDVHIEGDGKLNTLGRGNTTGLYS